MAVRRHHARATRTGFGRWFSGVDGAVSRAGCAGNASVLQRIASRCDDRFARTIAWRQYASGRAQANHDAPDETLQRGYDTGTARACIGHGAVRANCTECRRFGAPTPQLGGDDTRDRHGGVARRLPPSRRVFDGEYRFGGLFTLCAKLFGGFDWCASRWSAQTQRDFEQQR